METIDDIDHILSSTKTAVGILRWTSSRETTVRLKAPLEIDGALRSGLFLACDATVHTAPQQGSLVLVYRNVPLERMYVAPPAAHANPLHKSLPRAVRGLSLPSSVHRYYPWAANRRWPRQPGDNLAVAEAIDDLLDSFTAAIQYFATRARIAGEIPPPPHQPRLDLR